MSTNTVTNWFGDVVSHPARIVDANSVEDIVAVLRNPSQYPSPVRAVGSNHSTTPCGTAENGTLIRMRMNRIVNIGSDYLTVEAAARHIDLAKELEARNLQFYVNTEIGSLTAGSASCAGTKDASMPGEYGQVGSYVTGVKMILASGDALEVTDEKQPDLMRQIRCSYGTFGIVYEVTYKIKPLTPLAVHHKSFSLDDFLSTLPQLKSLGYSMMFYMFPFEDKITVEFRKYNPSASGEVNRVPWALRNHTWGTSGPKLAHDVEQNVSIPDIRYGIIDKFNALWRFQLENIVVSDNTSPPDQIIDYPVVSNDSRYTFSLFAFPEDQYPETLSAFFQFSKDYYKEHGYRTNLLDVGYWIAQDQNSLLSYSYDGPVMTLDPVSTGNPGWNAFINSYNQFCSDRGGKPLPNQTAAVTAEMVQKAYGDRLQKIAETREAYDPGRRLLNDYFRAILTRPVSVAAIS